MRPRWAEVVKKEIIAAIQHPKTRNEDANKPFITADQVRNIWAQLVRFQSHELWQEEDPQTLMPCNIDIPGKELLKVVSILVYIHWNSWSDFQSIFFDDDGSPRSDRRDTALPLSLETLANSDFLGDYAILFNEHQYAFLPIVIAENQDPRYGNRYRLPFTSESNDVDTGSYGEVTRVTVAKGQFCFAGDKIVNGSVSRWPEYSLFGYQADKFLKEKVLARKRMHVVRSWQQEVENLKILRGSRLGHKHIMQHIGTLTLGREFNIFFEWADKDLEKFLQSETRHNPKALVSQVMQLASALHYLHYQIVGADGSQIICCHMDLKPNNILVVREEGYPVGKWMIADFGISVFKNTKVLSIRDQATSLATKDSKNPPQRAPGPYQAPEVEYTSNTRGRLTDNHNSARVGRKGDVWSFGCVLATVLAFTLGGKAYVDDLKKSRSTMEAVSQENDRFYQPIRPRVYLATQMIVKPEVECWLTNIQEKNPLQWVADCVTLIRRTLEIDQEKRPSAGQVEGELVGILGLSFQRYAQSLPRPPQANAPDDRILPTLREDMVDTETEPLHVDRPVLARTVLALTATHTAGSRTHERERMGGLPLSNRTSQDPTSPASQDRSSRSSFSTMSWTFHESGKFSLDTEQQHLGRKAMATVLAICPSSERVAFCYKKGTLLLSRDLSDATGALKFGVRRLDDSDWRYLKLSDRLLLLKGTSHQSVSCMLPVTWLDIQFRLMSYVTDIYQIELHAFDGQSTRKLPKLQEIDTRLLHSFDASSEGLVVYRFARSLKLFNSS
jgi:serine/threonine protein kinase